MNARPACAHDLSYGNYWLIWNNTARHIDENAFFTFSLNHLFRLAVFYAC